MAKRTVALVPEEGVMKEVGESLVLLALTASSVGGLLGMVVIATHALAR